MQLAEQLTKNSTIKSNTKVSDHNDECFHWCGRDCVGNQFHRAVLANEVSQVRRLLDQDPALVRSRFHYGQIVYHDVAFVLQKQEQWGEALHLAASRGFVQVAELLLDRGADLGAAVLRGDEELYDVLHAAVFAEGRGGTKDMVQFLLDRNADMKADIVGREPLHLAFKTGKTQLIDLLKAEHSKKGGPTVADCALDAQDNKGLTPLHLAIEGLRLTCEEMSDIAPVNMKSLETFIHHEPECIPMFLKRMQDEDAIWTNGDFCKDVANLVNVKNLVTVMDRSERAGTILLDATTGEPECQNSGWNPLPKRVSMTPRDLKDKIIQRLNGPPFERCAYMPVDSWEYDSETFTHPTWQNTFKGGGANATYSDVDIKVCFIPNLVNAEFFTALARTDGAYVYDNPLICGTIDLLWWKSACRVDLIQLILTLWSLSLLVIELGGFPDALTAEEIGGNATERSLRPHQLVDHKDHHEDWNMLKPLPMSGAFLGARGILDGFLEIIQVLGLIRIGKGLEYLAPSNFYDLLRCISHIQFYRNTQDEYTRILVVFLNWLRLLEIFTFSETIGEAILPIVYAFHGVGPSAAVTAAVFFGFLQAFYAIDAKNRPLKDIVFDNFNTLITSALPEEVAEVSPIELWLTYLAVVVFTLFLLNIFITVIGESYNMQKQNVRTAMRKLRASRCQVFLLRSSCIPGRLFHRRIALGVTACAILGIKSIVWMMHWQIKSPGTATARGAVIAILACQAAMVFMAHQDMDAPYTTPCWGCQSKLVAMFGLPCWYEAPDTTPERDMYMWLAIKKEGEIESLLQSERFTRYRGDGESYNQDKTNFLEPFDAAMWAPLVEDEFIRLDGSRGFAL